MCIHAAAASSPYIVYGIHICVVHIYTYICTTHMCIHTPAASSQYTMRGMYYTYVYVQYIYIHVYPST